MSGNAKSSLPSLFGIVIIDLIGFGVVIPILPFYAESFGASATVLGMLVTCYAAMQFLLAPVWGRLSDRFGRRPVMLLTIAGTSIALAMMGLASSLAWLFAARFLGGIFGANISVASAYIADVTDESERTKYMGLLGASFAVGFTLGPAIGGGLAQFSYAAPMFLASGMAALNLIFGWFTLKEPKGAAGSAAASHAGRLKLPANPDVRKLCLAYFIFTVGVVQLETVFAFFMMDRFDYDATQVAYILVFMAIVMAIVQGGAIRPLSARFGERRLLFAGALLMMPSLAAVPFMTTIPWLLLPLAVSSIGRGIGHPAMLSLVSRAARPQERGLVMGTFQSSASLARVSAPIAAGALYDSSAEYPFLLAGLLMIVVVAVGTTLGPGKAASEAGVTNS